ncbi:MAG: STAS domain-containing protein [candidate division KSB1 bacterium]|nr:STAS domain-containing protein [candidate division KSB1 bacterium]MDZ7300527.1 STAS domain-containing protein [candidate division KSB1 bacterium]MDZ7309666.1 STAS domain-containing protein [candidate division KSB1 bacterium]
MNGFEVARADNGGISILRLKGYLDAHTAPDLESALQKLVDEKRVKIVVNFRDLTYISSAGLGVFMGFIEEVRNNGGDIKLTNMNQKIYRVFDLLGFPTLFEIREDESLALNSFSHHQSH